MIKRKDGRGESVQEDLREIVTPPPWKGVKTEALKDSDGTGVCICWPLVGLVLRWIAPEPDLGFFSRELMAAFIAIISILSPLFHPLVL